MLHEHGNGVLCGRRSLIYGHLDAGIERYRTGWTVELAKLFNRPLSVFDQNRNAWSTWQDNSWAESLPVIEHKTFVGTGTRQCC
jgi:hypothetical protein